MREQEPEQTRFKTIRDIAELCVNVKYARVKWRNAEELQEAIRDFCHRIREIDFRRQFPNLRYGAAKAVERAKNGNHEDLWRVLICFRIEAMFEPWILEQYRTAYDERDWKFMKGFFWALGKKQKITEGRKCFLMWWLLNPERIEGKTAGEILKAWNEKRHTLPVKQFGAVPTFAGDNAVQNFRRWLSNQGFTTGGQRGKKHRREHVT